MKSVTTNYQIYKEKIRANEKIETTKPTPAQHHREVLQGGSTGHPAQGTGNGAGDDQPGNQEEKVESEVTLGDYIKSIKNH